MRQALSDMDTTVDGRWQDSTLLNWIDLGNKRMVNDVRFPDCKVIVLTVANQQLYQFPLMLEVDAIYVGGELIVPSDLPTLEGRQIGYYDNTSGDGTVTTPATGGDQPSGSTGQSAPAWTVTEPATYPDATGTWQTGGRAPDAQPWGPYQRPRYYWRGGWLGLPRIPSSSGVPIQVDGVRQPDTIPYVSVGGVTQPQVMTTPENFKPGIVWAGMVWAWLSNADAGAQKMAEICEANYQREKRMMLSWRGTYDGKNKVEGPKPRTLRPQYAGQRVRRNSGGYGRW
jgi:hypothetical protein